MSCRCPLDEITRRSTKYRLTRLNNFTAEAYRPGIGAGPGSGLRFWKIRAQGRARAGMPGSGIPANPGFFQEYIQFVKYFFPSYLMILQRRLRSGTDVYTDTWAKNCRHKISLKVIKIYFLCLILIYVLVYFFSILFRKFKDPGKISISRRC